MAKEAKEKDFVPPELPVTAKAPEGYTQDEWGSLSRDEQEGILDSITNPEIGNTEELEDVDEEILEEIAKEDDEVKPEEKKPEEKPKEELPKKEEEKKPEEKLPEIPPEKPVEEAPVVDEKVNDDLMKLRFTVEDSEIPKDVLEPPKELIEGRKKALNDLKDKNASGEISDEDYLEKRDDIRDEYNRRIWDAVTTAKQEAVKGITWNKEQMAFLQTHPDYMGDKKADGKYVKTTKSGLLFGALNSAVSQLETDKPGLTGIQLLIEADKIVRSVFGGRSKPTETVPKKDEKPPVEIPDIKTLGDIPASAKNDTSDQWSVLDKLTGKAYEKVLNRLTPAQWEEYLKRV